MIDSVSDADKANKDLLGKWGQDNLSKSEDTRVPMEADKVQQAVAHVGEVIANNTLPGIGETANISFGGDPKEVTVTGLPEKPGKDAFVSVDIATASGIVQSNIDAQSLANLNKPPQQGPSA